MVSSISKKNMLQVATVKIMVDKYSNSEVINSLIFVVQQLSHFTFFEISKISDRKNVFKFEQRYN